MVSSNSWVWKREADATARKLQSLCGVADKFVAVLSQAFRTEKEAVADGADYRKILCEEGACQPADWQSVKHLATCDEHFQDSDQFVCRGTWSVSTCSGIIRRQTAFRYKPQTGGHHIGALVDAKEPALLLLTFLRVIPVPSLIQ